MWVIEVIPDHGEVCFYSEKHGFVEDRVCGAWYERHAAAVEMAEKVSRVYPQYVFRIVRV